MTDTLKTHALKIQVGTIAIVLLFIITSAWQLRGMKADVDSQLSTMGNRYEHVLKFYNLLAEKQEVLTVEDQKQDLMIVEINTKLKNIETMLLDIKKELDK